MDASILQRTRQQHGIIARWHLVGDGVPVARIDGWLRRNRLEHVAPGVYAVPGLRGARFDLAAAVFRFGRHAVASHDAAAELLGIVARATAVPDVSVSAGHPDRHAAATLHRVRLPADERTICDGIPVTTAARTLVDLAGRLSHRQLEQAVARACRLEIVREEELASIVARHRLRPGVRRLAAWLDPGTSPGFVRSEAEERFLMLVRGAGLSGPRVNARLRGYEVDFVWPEARVVVEIDGAAWHSSRSAQLRDRQRDTALNAAGYHVLRFTWADLTQRPIMVAARVAQALGRAGA